MLEFASAAGFAVRAARGRNALRHNGTLQSRAVGVAHKLFDKPAAALPLHGELHHDNIISSSRGWLAIDPKGLLGDPVYEVASSFINPMDAPKLVTDPRCIVRLADLYEARLGYNRKRMLGYAATHAALSACWDIGAAKPVTLRLTCCLCCSPPTIRPEVRRPGTARAPGPSARGTCWRNAPGRNSPGWPQDRRGL
ncbi:MAG: aminoglycoside phosphotransferase family protein, partial [Devosia sp.]